MDSITLPLPPSANALVRPALLGKLTCPRCSCSFMPKAEPLHETRCFAD